MIYGLWQSAAGLQANRYRQDVIASNLANIDTVGFKRDLAVFSERAAAAREPFGDPTMSNRLLDSMSGGTFVAPTVTSFEQGAIRPTERPLDLALDGDGFFTVRDGRSTRYTRDGRFTVGPRGDLLTVAGGKPVLSDQGAPIRIPPGQAGSVRFSQDGTVWAGTTAIAKLGLADFADRSQLRKQGANLLAAPEGAKPQAASATVVSGAVENSTVDPVTTMVAMIEASRAYQFNATMISMQDSMLGRLVNDVGRVSA